MNLAQPTEPSGSTRRYDVVLFDLDGTLWDSLPGIVASLAHTLEVMDLPVPDEATLAANIGPPLLEMLAHFGVPIDRLDDARVAYRDRYRRLGEFECTAYLGARELLGHLRDAGVRLATATSKGVEPTLRMLEHFELSPYFDFVGAASMDASAHHKVDVIAAAIAGLGDVDTARTAMVGDRHYDIEGALEHRLRAIGVAWGYGTTDELQTAGADLVVDSFDQLRVHLLDPLPN